MYNTIIQDNFFKNLNDIINISKQLKFYSPGKGDNWPGVRTESIHKTHYELFLEIINKIVYNYYPNLEFKFNNTKIYFAKVKPGDKGKSHFHYDDDVKIAAVIYLSEGDIKSGTTIFNKDKQQVVMSNDINTMISYDATKYHGPTNLDILQERLTLNIFIGNINIVKEHSSDTIKE
jgi:hypothetical protein